MTKKNLREIILDACTCDPCDVSDCWGVSPQVAIEIQSLSPLVGFKRVIEELVDEIVEFAEDPNIDRPALDGIKNSTVKCLVDLIDYWPSITIQIPDDAEIGLKDQIIRETIEGAQHYMRYRRWPSQEV